MKIFFQSVAFKLWFIIKNGPKIPKKIVGGVEIGKSEDEFDEENTNNMGQDSRAKYMLYRAVNPETFKRISKFKTAKEMWDEIHRSNIVLCYC
ncbi:hypothetical protein Ahy_B04g070468 [Arachis hypogaea]|uniref:Uncharacterized protein n=1 Tax=Arachis hypogaea TaxID=3818 RepID=A0A444ZH47_ARAHY|nr:hypothetical protein Ahy_B04g070468 [Arachis hypogaea]